MPELEDNIQEALAGFANGPLRDSSVRMLSTLGYQSDRTLSDINNTEDFLRWGGPKLKENDIEILKKHWAEVKFIFQITADEIHEQSDLSATIGFDRGSIKSFLFFAVDLTKKDYPRGRLAQMTRIANRISPIPMILIYRYNKSQGGRVITTTVIHRRPHKREPSRDVLEKITLIKDVKVKNPHRAHLQILSNLSLRRLKDTRDFDDLHEKWEKALDTKPLNRRFYQELFEWFKRAVEEGKWSPDADSEQQVIRLVTRILFVWFIKEKGLIAEDWFEQGKMENLLHRFGGSDYYRAVLENLFFATLNVPIEQRTWNKVEDLDQSDLSYWRYKSLIRQVERFENLMSQTPFINGGLFDCLDYEDSEWQSLKNLDIFKHTGLTNNITNIKSFPLLNISDSLFFDAEGLYPLLNRYKFTVEENTPTEIEVALDPELLGQVFENLLAAYNPETRDPVRNQTGSYYTPREVVNYMVDEALVTALSAKLKSSNSNLNPCSDQLRSLFDYKNTEEPFKQEAKKEIVHAISKLKILDPAVGSGAFPMAILHKLTIALRHLDPTNQLWKDLQKNIAVKRSEKAYSINIQSQREEDLINISEVFEHYSDDFGRKLYLIQNSIYGVDIQPIACQIAKLRFFISLAIEQVPDPALENFGIKPLPNLETRFVVADSLVPLKPPQLELSYDQYVTNVEEKILGNRERYFHATKRSEKSDCKRIDKRLREKLADELKKSGVPTNEADKLVRWDPYNQNHEATWFDPEYMFGIRDGFDVIIGNPPYIQLQKNKGKLADKYKKFNYFTYERTGDIYQLFFERGCNLLRRGGALAYITSNSWLKAKYGKSLREYLTAHFNPLSLIDMGKDVFDADVDTSILILKKSNIEQHQSKIFQGVDLDRVPNTVFPPPSEQWNEVRPCRSEIWRILSNLEWGILEKMKDKGLPLKDWDNISIYRGITTGCNEAFLINETTRDRLISEDPRSAEILKPAYRGRDIQRYRAKYANRWLITTFPSLTLEINDYPAIKRHLLTYGRDRLAQTGERLPDGRNARKKTRHQWFELQDTCAYHEHFSQEKLFWITLSNTGRFAYFDQSETFCLDNAFMLTGQSIKFLCAMLNSNIVQWFISNTAPTSGMGVLQWKKTYLQELYLPMISSDRMGFVTRLVEQILQTKHNNIMDISKLENEIDQYIYELYGLTTAEKERIINIKQKNLQQY